MTLEEALGFEFEEPALLRLALTHRSVSSENPARHDNERLEFLGDAVLQLIITRRLYEDFPHLAEGKMAKVRAAVVSRPNLAEVARSIGLGEHVELAPSEERTGGREKDSILADAMEAVIGAIYLDAGLDVATRVIGGLWNDRLVDRARQPGVKDYKTRVQEVLAREGLRPEYHTIGSGPDHARSFASRLEVQGRIIGEGAGRSKKEAEQAAARLALDTLSRRSR